MENQARADTVYKQKRTHAGKGLQHEEEFKKLEVGKDFMCVFIFVTLREFELKLFCVFQEHLLSLTVVFAFTMLMTQPATLISHK